MIKAICFDLDGVYFTPAGKQGFVGALRALGIPSDIVEYALYQSREMNDFVRGKCSEEDFLTFFSAYTGHQFSREEYIRLLTKEYVIDSDVQRYIHALRKEGYLACVCSNNTSIRIEALETRFHFLSDFDVVILSYETGFLKPERGIFEALLAKSGVAPEELVYADDNPARLRGAEELRMQAFVYENFSQFQAELTRRGVLVGQAIRPSGSIDEDGII